MQTDGTKKIPNENQEVIAPLSEPPLIVIGSGPAGIHFTREFLKKKPNAKILLFGNEPYTPYNRVQLSAFLAGDIDRETLDYQLPNKYEHTNFSYINAAIRKIIPSSNQVQDKLGTNYNYSKLVLAVGARAHIPSINGVDQRGVYTFRNMKDVDHLYSRITRSRHLVVVGGGLLGLEAAKALLRLNTKITVIQQASRLMNRQLDDSAAHILQDEIEALGISVITNSGVRQIYGEGTVTGVRLYSGKDLDCDSVLLCTGITPNTELAKAASLKVAKGIVVTDDLQTSLPNIYALGECCQHNDMTYGLVAPGLEQAAVLADQLTGGNASYVGSVAVSKLKVAGQNVTSMGEVNDFNKRPFLKEVHHKSTSSYRKLVIHRGKILGATGIGEWPEAYRVQESFRSGRRITWLQSQWFRLTGQLWLQTNSKSVLQWPENAIVCQCNAICKSKLTAEIANGCNTAALLQEKTSAGTVCGSCKPLLTELTGSTTKLDREKSWPAILIAAVIATLLVSSVVIKPESQIAESVQQRGWFEYIWNNKFWKQVTGFTLLGLSLLGLLMSLRKRINISWLGNYGSLRLVHFTLGVCCSALLIFHTGFHTGSNLNQILLFNFIGVILLGSMASTVLALSHTLKPASVTSMKKFWNWAHILFSWPLPALLGIHILTVYYF